jgi:predicted permease
MGWREAWRLGGVAFGELSFQAVYAFRQGNIVPVTSSKSLVPKGRSRVTQSKGIVSALLALLAIGAAGFLHNGARFSTALFGYAIPSTVLDTGVLTGLLTLDAAFLWWTGLQVLPTLLSSAVLPVLETLPLDPATFRRAAAILYLRLFDLPILTVLVVTPIALGVALGAAAGLAILPGVLASVVFALALSLVTGRFFVHRIQGARGGGSGTAVRWMLLVLWLLPSFAILGFVTTGTRFLFLLQDVTMHGGASVLRDVIYATYPVPFALLTGVAADGTAGVGLDRGAALAFAAGAAVYLGLVAWAALWLFREIRELGHLPLATAAVGPATSYRIRPQTAAWAVLTKDLRIASRTPGYAFLLLLPILDAVALGLLTVVDAPQAAAARSLAIGTVTAAALLATFFGPAFFAIEVLAYSYGRTLPLRDRSVVLGKATLICLIYLVASAIVLALASLRVADPGLFLAFVAAELPAVLAAAFIELGWLFRRARAKGFPVANLYSGGWIAFLIAIPGLFVAGVPLLAYALVGLPAMAIVALAELAILAPYALGGTNR